MPIDLGGKMIKIFDYNKEKSIQEILAMEYTTLVQYSPCPDHLLHRNEAIPYSVEGIYFLFLNKCRIWSKNMLTYVLALLAFFFQNGVHCY